MKYQVKYEIRSNTTSCEKSMMEASSGSFRLSWEEFDISAGNSYKELFEEQLFTNVTLACDDGKQIKAHKVILSSSSGFFKRILTKNPHDHPLIYLKGFDFSELEKIIQFLYQGCAEVRQANLNRFLEAARELEIKGLMNHTFVKEEKKTEPVNDWSEENVESEVVPYTLAHPNSVKQFEFPVAKEDNYFEEVSDIKPSSDKELHPCNKCERQFTSRSGLWLHKQKVHEGITHKCDLCESVFSQQTHLKRHRARIHTDTALLAAAKTAYSEKNDENTAISSINP